MNQGIMHIPTGRWVTHLLETHIRLGHDPFYIEPELRQNFGETKLHSVLNQFKKRDQFVVKTFDPSPSISLKIR